MTGEYIGQFNTLQIGIG